MNGFNSLSEKVIVAKISISLTFLNEKLTISLIHNAYSLCKGEYFITSERYIKMPYVAVNQTHALFILLKIAICNRDA